MIHKIISWLVKQTDLGQEETDLILGLNYSLKK